MSARSKRDMLRAVYPRYHKARGEVKSRILDEFCATTGYHRTPRRIYDKYAIHLLNGPMEEVSSFKPRKRGHTYTARTVRVLAVIWEAAGYPWSARLKAMLPVWLPWARRHIKELTPEVEKQLLKMSPRRMDRRLKDKKRALGRRIYGRTKPGTLLKHHIPIKTHAWDVDTAGFAEIGLVSHSRHGASTTGNNASGPPRRAQPHRHPHRMGRDRRGHGQRPNRRA